MKDSQSERNKKKKWKIVLIAVIAVAVCGGLLWAVLSALLKTAILIWKTY